MNQNNRKIAQLTELRNRKNSKKDRQSPHVIQINKKDDRNDCNNYRDITYKLSNKNCLGNYLENNATCPKKTFYKVQSWLRQGRGKKDYIFSIT